MLNEIMKPRIHDTKPSITELKIRYITDAATNGWGNQCYAYVNRFEGLFKQHLGVSLANAISRVPEYCTWSAPSTTRAYLK
ncbi:MAG: hypothetical protein H7829_06650 [Magnetococcus sp. THC-1_WYH]